MSTIITFIIWCITLALCIAVGFFFLNLIMAVAALVFAGIATVCMKVGEWFTKLFQ